MLSRSTLIIAFALLSFLGFSGCKSVYSDTFAYRKNSFKAPVVKQPEIKPPTNIPMPLEGAAGAGVPAAGGGGIPGVPAPDAGGIPGAVPGLPAAAPAAPGAPPTPAPATPGTPPAVPGLN